MTSTDGQSRGTASLLAGPDRLAETARSILACPAGVELVVDGTPLALTAADGSEALPGLRDREGTPTFVCGLDSALSFAGAAGHSALVKVTSALGVPGAPDRELVLSIAGRLRTAGREECGCCDEVRDIVVLDPGFVLLARVAADGSVTERARVPLAAFRSPAHQLNRGYLQRSAEHANDCHQHELRRAVAAFSGIRFGSVIGVQLADLTVEGAQLRWVDVDGAHSREIRFPWAAASADELGDLLRSQLHPGIC